MNLRPGQILWDKRIKQMVQVVYVMTVEECHAGQSILKRTQVGTRILGQDTVNVDTFDVEVRDRHWDRGEFPDLGAK
jgi:hypothetical protein